MCILFLSINNNNLCPRSTLSDFKYVSQVAHNFRLQGVCSFSSSLDYHTKFLFHQPCPSQVSKVAWSMVYIEEQEGKKELSNEESNWKKKKPSLGNLLLGNTIENLHHSCFCRNGGANKGNISLVIVLEYLDTIKKPYYFVVSHIILYLRLIHCLLDDNRDVNRLSKIKYENMISDIF